MPRPTDLSRIGAGIREVSLRDFHGSCFHPSYHPRHIFAQIPISIEVRHLSPAGFVYACRALPQTRSRRSSASHPHQRLTLASCLLPLALIIDHCPLYIVV
jgi:hypothetical protein